METFRAVSVTACFLGIVIAVFNSLYPSEKFAGQLKIIFSLIFILSLIKPIAGGKFDLPEIAEAAAASSAHYEALSSKADDYFVRSAESSISETVKAVLRENRIYPEEVETSINISEDYSISISEVKITLKNSAEAETVRQCVSEQLGISAAVTVIIAEDGAENGKEERQ